MQTQNPGKSWSEKREGEGWSHKKATQATHHQLYPALPQLSIRSTGSTGSTGSTEIRATGTMNGRGRCRRMIQFLSTETPALNPIILTYKIEVGEGGMEKAN